MKWSVRLPKGPAVIPSHDSPAHRTVLAGVGGHPYARGALADDSHGPPARLTAPLATLALLLALGAAPAHGAVSTGDAPQGPMGALPPAAPDPGPTIAGTARDGQTLTGSEGDWGPSTTEHIWLRCSDAGIGCSQVSVSVTYALSAADVGKRLKFRVRGTALVGGGTREAEAVTAVVDAIPPDLASPPAVSGTARDASTLTGSPGTGLSGSEPIVSSFTWLSCDAAGASCSALTTPSSSPGTLPLTPADVGRRIRLRQTLQGPQDSVDRDSEATGVVTAAPPTNTTPPSIAGTPREGATLTATPGAWRGTPTISFGYVWSRCSASCVQVATGPSYRPSRADVGSRIKLEVTASNAGGSAALASVSGVVAGLATGGSAPPPGGGVVGMRRLSPFPVIAVGGRVTRRGARFTFVQIKRAPKGSRVTVTCSGRRCPFRRAGYVMKRSTLRLRSLERGLLPGTVITITIRKGATIGKFTRLRILRGVAPARTDSCIRPESSRPTRCA